MKRETTTVAAFLVLLLSLGISETFGCSWAIGYFEQVTALKGTVVGSNFPLLHRFRWFRRSIIRPRTKLAIYNYCFPCDVGKLTPAKAVLADDHGKFDFGRVTPGHYYLWIADEEGGLYDEFEIEVKQPIDPKQSVMIDISAAYPDCKGGHEFTVRGN